MAAATHRETKRCSRCKTVKAASEFFTTRNHYGSVFLQAHCKACKAEAARAYRASHRRPGRTRYYYPPFGQNSHQAKLVDDDIRLIRALLADGLSCAEIGRKFEVSRQSISAIKSGRAWTHV